MIQLNLARIWRSPLIGRQSVDRTGLNRRTELNQRTAELKRRIYNILHIQINEQWKVSLQSENIILKKGHGVCYFYFNSRVGMLFFEYAACMRRFD